MMRLPAEPPQRLKWPTMSLPPGPPSSLETMLPHRRVWMKLLQPT
jgi:hypothetical protein